MQVRRIAILALSIVAVAIAWWAWPRSDKSLAEAVVGTWRAVDPNNGALHKRSEGVKNEEVTFRPDGTLIYVVESLAGGPPPKTEQWGWRVQKRRLQLQYLGEGSTQEWMSPVKLSVSATRLSLYRKSFPVKEFTRVSS